MEHYEEQDYSSEKFSAQVWKKILSKVFKRKKNILEGTSTVIINSIVEKQHENGKTYFIITVKRNSDGATREFWINYVIFENKLV